MKFLTHFKKKEKMMKRSEFTEEQVTYVLRQAESEATIE
jgi:hypothetical protein